MEKLFRPKPNAFKNTFCVFHERSLDEIKGIQISFESKAGSNYYYTERGMYRLSNHWGRLANSKWRLVPSAELTDSKFKLGFALWDSFYPDNEVDALYYLDPDYTTNTITYQHKNNPNYDNNAILRTSFETTKKIKQARNLLQLTSWAKYFDYEDIAILRKSIVDQLVFTTKTLEVIKSEMI
jgi:hypothetical protein